MYIEEHLEDTPSQKVKNILKMFKQIRGKLGFLGSFLKETIDLLGTVKIKL